MSRKPPFLEGFKRAWGQFEHCAKIAFSIWGLTSRRVAPGPVYAQIGLADPCNHKCVMCGDHPPEDRKSPSTESAFDVRPGVMSLPQFKTVVDDLCEMGTKRVQLVAEGEPMLNKHAVDMVGYAKQKGMRVGMVTNGSLLYPERAEALVDMRMDRLQISLNAGKPETYPRIHVTETPEKFLKVKAHLRHLADYKAATGSSTPHVRISFIISRVNCFELEQMVEAVAEVGANEAGFYHVVVHEGTQDLKLTENDYEKMRSLIPGVRKLSAKLGILSNLKSFAATPPSYLHDQIKGPRVVPCYAGSFFTRVHGNGITLPCCQCKKPIGQVTDKQNLESLWNSSAYRKFRKAARSLPEESDVLDGCECGHCVFRPWNITIHNFLFPFNRIHGGEGDMLFKLTDLFRGRKVDS